MYILIDQNVYRIDQNKDWTILEKIPNHGIDLSTLGRKKGNAITIEVHPVMFNRLPNQLELWEGECKWASIDNNQILTSKDFVAQFENERVLLFQNKYHLTNGRHFYHINGKQRKNTPIKGWKQERIEQYKLVPYILDFDETQNFEQSN